MPSPISFLFAKNHFSPLCHRLRYAFHCPSMQHVGGEGQSTDVSISSSKKDRFFLVQFSLE